MARNLKTSWVTLATSGSVIHGDEDGRYIKKEWLQDMAETYNTKVHTAKIWPDHRRYMVGGSVLALKVEPATEPELEGEVQLFGILAPNDWLIMANRYGEYSHPSIEVGENYRGTGKFFLKGLGVTDEPASAGVTELKFSSRNGEEKAVVFAGHQFNLAESVQREKTLLERVFSRESPNPSHEQESEAMTEEQFNKLEEALTGLGKKVADLEKKFESKGAGQGAGEGGAGEGGTSEEFQEFKKLLDQANELSKKFGQEEAPSEKEAASKADFKALQDQLSDLSKNFAKALGKEMPGTTVPQGQGEGGLGRVL